MQLIRNRLAAFTSFFPARFYFDIIRTTFLRFAATIAINTDLLHQRSNSCFQLRIGIHTEPVRIKWNNNIRRNNLVLVFATINMTIRQDRETILQTRKNIPVNFSDRCAGIKNDITHKLTDFLILISLRENGSVRVAKTIDQYSAWPSASICVSMALSQNFRLSLSME